MLNHRGTLTINTNRLILRKFKIDDVESMFNNWANDSEVTRFLEWKPHGNIEVTRDIVSLWIKEYRNDDVYNWIIELKNPGEVIGGISVVNLEERNLACEIGYCMSKKYWGMGIMSEALRAVIDFLFTEAGFNRIIAKHDTNNAASGRVMVKAGMKYEGTLRQAKFREGHGFYDLSIYAILREDWISAK